MTVIAKSGNYKHHLLEPSRDYYEFPFTVYDENDLDVLVVSSTSLYPIRLELTKDYFVKINPDNQFADIYLKDRSRTGELLVYRNTNFTQPEPINSLQDVENALDRTTISMQDIDDRTMQHDGSIYNAHGKPISNVGVPHDDSDAITKRYFDDSVKPFVEEAILNASDAGQHAVDAGLFAEAPFNTKFKLSTEDASVQPNHYSALHYKTFAQNLSTQTATWYLDTQKYVESTVLFKLESEPVGTPASHKSMQMYLTETQDLKDSARNWAEGNNQYFTFSVTENGIVYNRQSARYWATQASIAEGNANTAKIDCVASSALSKNWAEGSDVDGTFTLSQNGQIILAKSAKYYSNEAKAHSENASTAKSDAVREKNEAVTAKNESIAGSALSKNWAEGSDVDGTFTLSQNGQIILAKSAKYYSNEAKATKGSADIVATNAAKSAVTSENWATGGGSVSATFVDSNNITQNSSKKWAQLSQVSETNSGKSATTAQNWAIGSNAQFTFTDINNNIQYSAKYYANSAVASTAVASASSLESKNWAVGTNSTDGTFTDLQGVKQTSSKGYQKLAEVNVTATIANKDLTYGYSTDARNFAEADVDFALTSEPMGTPASHKSAKRSAIEAGWHKNSAETARAGSESAAALSKNWANGGDSPNGAFMTGVTEQYSAKYYAIQAGGHALNVSNRLELCKQIYDGNGSADLTFTDNGTLKYSTKYYWNDVKLMLDGGGSADGTYRDGTIIKNSAKYYFDKLEQDGLTFRNDCLLMATGLEDWTRGFRTSLDANGPLRYSTLFYSKYAHFYAEGDSPDHRWIDPVDGAIKESCHSYYNKVKAYSDNLGSSGGDTSGRLDNLQALVEQNIGLFPKENLIINGNFCWWQARSKSKLVIPNIVGGNQNATNQDLDVCADKWYIIRDLNTSFATENAAFVAYRKFYTPSIESHIAGSNLPTMLYFKDYVATNQNTLFQMIEKCDSLFDGGLKYFRYSIYIDPAKYSSTAKTACFFRSSRTGNTTVGGTEISIKVNGTAIIQASRFWQLSPGWNHVEVSMIFDALHNPAIGNQSESWNAGYIAPFIQVTGQTEWGIKGVQLGDLYIEGRSDEQELILAKRYMERIELRGTHRDVKLITSYSYNLNQVLNGSNTTTNGSMFSFPIQCAEKMQPIEARNTYYQDFKGQSASIDRITQDISIATDMSSVPTDDWLNNVAILSYPIYQRAFCDAIGTNNWTMPGYFYNTVDGYQGAYRNLGFRKTFGWKNGLYPLVGLPGILFSSTLTCGFLMDIFINCDMNYNSVGVGISASQPQQDS